MSFLLNTNQILVADSIKNEIDFLNRQNTSKPCELPVQLDLPVSGILCTFCTTSQWFSWAVRCHQSQGAQSQVELHELPIIVLKKVWYSARTLQITRTLLVEGKMKGINELIYYQIECVQKKWVTFGDYSIVQQIPGVRLYDIEY